MRARAHFHLMVESVLRNTPCQSCSAHLCMACPWHSRTGHLSAHMGQMGPLMLRSNHMLLRAVSILAQRCQKCRRSDPAPPVPPPAAAGVHARRTHGPCASDLIPCIRGAPARANRAPPCPHTDLLVAHPVQPADLCLAWLSLCVQRRSCCAEHGRSPGLQPLWCVWGEFSGPEGRQAAAGRRLGMVWCFSSPCRGM